LRRYETFVILNVEHTEEERESLIKRWLDLIQKFKGEVVKVENWGQKRLAYDIKKQSRGHYILIDYVVKDTLLIKELERILRIEDKVLKYLTVKISDRVNIEALREEERKRQEIRQREEVTDQPKETTLSGEEILEEEGEIE
jgi:small subunit ribosomal protein S6